MPCLCAPLLLVPTVFFSAQTAAEPKFDPDQTNSETAAAQEIRSVASLDDQHSNSSSAINQDDEALSTELIEESLARDQDAGANWADDSHEYIGTKADDLAIYLDRFFGSPIEDLESADSNVRFSTRLEWDQDAGSDVGFRLRGNVHLPRISERLSLVFDGESDNDSDDAEGGGRKDEQNQVGLQLNAVEGDRSRFDFTLSASSDLSLKPGVRYRFKDDLADWGRFRYTGRVDYSDKNRFRHRHTVELDYLTGDTSILRLSNKLESGQRSDGIEWGTAVSWRYGYSLDSAVAFVLAANGRTEPEVPQYVVDDPIYAGAELDESSLVNNYVVKANFRNRLYKDWLYIEFEPGYSRRQRNHFEDRHGVFFARVNFEVLFNRGRRLLARKAEQSSAVAESGTSTSDSSGTN